MTALRASESHHSKDPPEQRTPRPPARLSRRVSRQPPPDRRRSLLRLPWRRSNARPKPRTRRQNPVIMHLVRPRLRSGTSATSLSTSSSRLSSSAVVPSLHARFSAIRTRPSGSDSTRSFASGGRAMYRHSCRAAPPLRGCTCPPPRWVSRRLKGRAPSLQPGAYATAVGESPTILMSNSRFGWPAWAAWSSRSLVASGCQFRGAVCCTRLLRTPVCTDTVNAVR